MLCWRGPPHRMCPRAIEFHVTPQCDNTGLRAPLRPCVFDVSIELASRPPVLRTLPNLCRNNERRLARPSARHTMAPEWWWSRRRDGGFQWGTRFRNRTVILSVHTNGALRNKKKKRNRTNQMYDVYNRDKKNGVEYNKDVAEWNKKPEKQTDLRVSSRGPNARGYHVRDYNNIIV